MQRYVFTTSRREAACFKLRLINISACCTCCGGLECANLTPPSTFSLPFPGSMKSGHTSCIRHAFPATVSKDNVVYRSLELYY
ncbi:hypothetical protein GDO78_006176 [Eleutherodactylus coqui]|uniref:Uncharacterized protein n=1 Tax=Eleutherodactylus coqui TaxID=57060 RepID=A0A8J6KGG5_ELECQ|nr:hypothetical protein GDO78_006176 [Eleutherodactylus coqui]